MCIAAATQGIVPLSCLAVIDTARPPMAADTAQIETEDQEEEEEEEHHLHLDLGID